MNRYAAARQYTISIIEAYHVAIHLHGFGRYVRCKGYWPGTYLNLVKSPMVWAALTMFRSEMCDRI